MEIYEYLSLSENEQLETLRDSGQFIAHRPSTHFVPLTGS